MRAKGKSGLIESEFLSGERTFPGPFVCKVFQRWDLGFDYYLVNLLRPLLPAVVSAAVVGGGFGVDEEAADFRDFELEGVFEGGNDLVDAAHGELVRHGAVAGDLEAVVMARDGDVVDVQDLGEGECGVAEGGFEVAIAIEGGGALDGGGFGFDVGEDGGDGGNFAAHLGFQAGDDVVCGAEREGFVDFEVEVDVECGAGFLFILLD